MGGKPLTGKENDQAKQNAYSAFYDPDANKRFKAANAGQSMDVVGDRLKNDLGVLGKEGADPLLDDYRLASNRVWGDVMALTENVADPKERAALQKDIKERGFIGKDTKGRAFLEGGRFPVDLLNNPALQTSMALGSSAADTLRKHQDYEEDFLAKAFGGAGDEKDQLLVGRRMRENKRYQKARDMIKSGKHTPEQINAEMQAGYRETIVDMGGAEDSTKVVGGMGAPVDVGTGAFDISKIDYRTKHAPEKKGIPGLPAPVDDMLDQMANLMGMGTAKAQSVSLGDMIVGEADPGRKALYKKSGPQVQTRSIGFGEQEQAMSAINRSLQRTHGMLTALDKRISAMPIPTSGGGGGAPAVPPTAQNGTNLP
jgi:hypothetical protein